MLVLNIHAVCDLHFIEHDRNFWKLAYKTQINITNADLAIDLLPDFRSNLFYDGSFVPAHIKIHPQVRDQNDSEQDEKDAEDDSSIFFQPI